MGTTSKYLLSLIFVFLAVFSPVLVESAHAQLQQLPIFPSPSPTPVPEQIAFSSGLIVYSPLNKVYNSSTVFCSASLRVPYGYQSGIIYRLDGVEQDTSNFKLNFGGMGKYHLDGAFMLPPLENGVHNLTFNIRIELFNYSGPPPSNDFKPKVTSYGVKYYEAEYENIVKFSVYSTEPITTPAPTMTTPSPSPTPPFSSNRNAPHLDPLYYLIPASVLGIIVVLSVLAFRRHRKTSKFEYKKSTVEYTNGQ